MKPKENLGLMVCLMWWCVR